MNTQSPRGRDDVERNTVASWSPTAIETHISALFFVGDRVFKLKKPVQLQILDWRTREAREAACHREVELNRRLSPDVYLGVYDIVDGDGPVDHLVVMRRMPLERRLSRLLAERFEVGPALRVLADRLARFHAGAERSPAISANATVDAVDSRWSNVFDVLRGHVGDADVDPFALDGATVERIADLSARYLAGRRPLFDARLAGGFVVDGHGDLMAEDIYLLEDGPRVLDCIEFSDALRSVDVLDDVCFLAMDLERFGSAAVAEDFLDAYLQASGEHHPASLADHWIAYRACVRAYVACVRSDQGRIHAADDIAEARILLDLALRHLERGRVRLVVVGGLPGTGKSTVANAVAGTRGWPVLHSDVVRKELLGLAPTDPAAASFGAGAYSEEMTVRTYDELLDRAATLLGSGECVVLDATWNDEAMRERVVTLARSTASDLVVLECVAPADVAAARIDDRRDTVGSDATAAVAAGMAAHTRPWDLAVTLDTIRSVESTVAAALDAVD